MMTLTKPAARPGNPCFSSGPTAKHPGWTLQNLKNALLGRSHRASEPKARLKEVIARTHTMLSLPDDYLCAIVPASDTGAVEMAMWNLLGPRPVDVLAWESFGKDWIIDAVKQLKLADCRTLIAEFGTLPDLTTVRPEADVVFTWNGTTSGVRVPDGDWIADDRGGLTICDATSAAFAQDLPWPKLDVTTFSWQKAMGGEAAHGMLILSPCAVERLETYVPDRPLPKIFRLTKGGGLNQAIFEGTTINTPSMLCVEDYLDALKWAEEIGGIKALFARSDTSLEAITAWVSRTHWIDFLASDPATRSNTSICLKFTDPSVTGLDEGDQRAFCKSFTGLLDRNGIAFDLNGYRDAPPGLRIWCGATVEPADVEALLPWLDWCFAEVKSAQAA